MAAVHQHFGLDDGHQARFLAQRGVARERMGVGGDAASAGPAGSAVAASPVFEADADHAAPLGKAGAHVAVRVQALAQPVQAFGDFLAGVPRQVLGTDVDLDADEDARVCEDFGEWHAIGPALADGLVVQDHATDGSAQPRRGQQQFPVGAPRVHGLLDAGAGETLVARGGAFVHRQQALATGQQRSRHIDQRRRVQRNSFGVHGHLRFETRSLRRTPVAVCAVARFALLSSTVQRPPVANPTRSHSVRRRTDAPPAAGQHSDPKRRHEPSRRTHPAHRDPACNRR